MLVLISQMARERHAHSKSNCYFSCSSKRVSFAKIYHSVPAEQISCKRNERRFLLHYNYVSNSKSHGQSIIPFKLLHSKRVCLYFARGTCHVSFQGKSLTPLTYDFSTSCPSACWTATLKNLLSATENKGYCCASLYYQEIIKFL
mmetsp:Transcript_40406/g.127189  ORF Transcript_40406/g.127189 Transcript_40406/m.127189 type:complete len:145 (-) Transcript_40406:683-1117(-)